MAGLTIGAGLIQRLAVLVAVTETAPAGQVHAAQFPQSALQGELSERMGKPPFPIRPEFLDTFRSGAIDTDAVLVPVQRREPATPDVQGIGGCPPTLDAPPLHTDRCHALKSAG